MNMVRKLLTGFLLAGATVSMLSAQNAISPKANIVNHKTFEWKKVSTQFFDLHYYSPDQGLAIQAGKISEESLYDICRLFDYRNSSRYSIYLYTSPYDLIQSNQFPEDQVREGGITPIRNNTVGVVWPGTSAGFQKTLKTAVASLLIEDFFYGGTVQSSIQNTVLLHTPKWFSEGLPAFIGEGWTFEDEVWLTSLEKENLLDYALEGDGYVNHIARKSIWYYIVNQYGPEKLAEVFYMTRLTRSVDSGIIHVLGITLKTLTERWWEFALQRISENKEYREAFDENAKQLKAPNGDRILGYAVNPKKPIVAVYHENLGKHRISLYDIPSKSWSDTPIKTGWRTDQLNRFAITQPMVWSPDGKRLLAVAFHESEEEMALYQMESGEVTWIPFRPGLERITSLSWSHDGTYIAASGLRQGMVDVYVTTPGNGRFRQVTNDLYDDLNPIWSQDDLRLYYASTRNIDTLGGRVSYNHFRNPTDIFGVDAKDGGEMAQVTHSPYYSEVPVRMSSSFEMTLLTDQSGIYNLMNKNVFVGDSAFRSNITQGFLQVQFSDSMMVFSTPSKGQQAIYYTHPEAFSGEWVVLDARLRYNENLAYKKKEKLKELQAEVDSLRKVQENQKEKVQDPVPSTRDTASKETKVKYYVFDDEGVESPDPNSRNRILKSKKRKNAVKTIERPNFDTVSVSTASISKAQWTPTRITSAFRFDPVFKLNMALEAELTDQEGNRRINVGFRPYIDLRSADFYVQYGSLKRRIDWYGDLTYTTRYLNRSDFLLRYSSVRAEGMGVLPINRFTSVGAGMHTALIRRLDLNIFSPVSIDGTEFVGGARAFIRYDSRKNILAFTRSGSYANLGLESVYSIKNKQPLFTTARWDVRRFQPIFGNLVLAGKLHGAFSFGQQRQQFFLGGTDEWLFSQFLNPADFPIAGDLAGYRYMEYATPVRGFLFNARNGTRYMAASAELRMPLSRMSAKALNTNPLYNIEFIPFFDVGTAWREGNPLSQRNPIDTEVIDSYPLNIRIQTLKSPFVMGFGGGLRLMTFGYSVRADLAWGVEDYTVLTPKLHLTLARNF